MYQLNRNETKKVKEGIDAINRGLKDGKNFWLIEKESNAAKLVYGKKKTPIEDPTQIYRYIYIYIYTYIVFFIIL